MKVLQSEASVQLTIIFYL